MDGNRHARDRLIGCRVCTLVQQRPSDQRGKQLVCAGCGSALEPPLASAIRSNSRAAALAIAALILYPLGVLLPMLRIEQFGRGHEASIVRGVIELLSGGHVFVGIVVLLCSIVIPLGKLLAILLLSTGAIGARQRAQARLHRFVEWTGRWGMLDVLLVAILVAALKLGDLVDVSPGAAAWAFVLMVILSLLASACFDPAAALRRR